MMKSLVLSIVLTIASTPSFADPDCGPRLDQRLKQKVLAHLGWTTPPSPNISAELRKRVRALEDQFVIPKDLVDAWSREFNLTPERLLTHFLPFVAETARPPTSEYFVGVAGLTAGGAIVVGNNLEFPPLPHVMTVHGETFLIALAHQRNLGPITAIALGGPACGHCRQFMYETVGAQKLKVLVLGRRARPLRKYLLEAFDPSELGVKGLLLTPQTHALRLAAEPADALALHALAQARRAYAPYTKRPAGVALRTRDGRIFGGSYIENVNWNSSLDPMAAALVDLASRRVAYEDVVEIVLAELPSVNRNKDISFEHTSRLIGGARLPNAKFRKVPVYFL